MPKRLSKRELKRYLGGRHVAVLATIGKNGEPVLTPIWYLYLDGKIMMRTGKEAGKVKNIQRDPRVTVCVQDERPPYSSATIYGTATIEPQKPELGPKMARHYLGAIGAAGYKRTAAEQIEADGGEITIVVTPERMTTQDFSLETPLVGKVWLQLRRILPPWL
ncbi:MAG: PPOX class F420-dependent oxidoreductase [Chloroflexota bacterium]